MTDALFDLDQFTASFSSPGKTEMSVECFSCDARFTEVVEHVTGKTPGPLAIRGLAYRAGWRPSSRFHPSGFHITCPSHPRDERRPA